MASQMEVADEWETSEETKGAAANDEVETNYNKMKATDDCKPAEEPKGAEFEKDAEKTVVVEDDATAKVNIARKCRKRRKHRGRRLTLVPPPLPMPVSVFEDEEDEVSEKFEALSLELPTRQPRQRGASLPGPAYKFNVLKPGRPRVVINGPPKLRPNGSAYTDLEYDFNYSSASDDSPEEWWDHDFANNKVP